jgi:hypothetical protein
MSVLEKFTVIDLIKTRSDSVATITGNFLKFNNQTARELQYAPYVQVLINPKDKQFAIRACKADAPSAVSFSKPENEQKYQIKISTAAVVHMIRKMANWSDEGNWNVPGIYFAEDNAIIYDVSTAYKPVSKGGGWEVKHQRDAAALAEKATGDISEEVDG